jgi:hypothetical protein
MILKQSSGTYWPLVSTPSGAPPRPNAARLRATLSIDAARSPRAAVPVEESLRDSLHCAASPTRRMRTKPSSPRSSRRSPVSPTLAACGTLASGQALARVRSVLRTRRLAPRLWALGGIGVRLVGGACAFEGHAPERCQAANEGLRVRRRWARSRCPGRARTSGGGSAYVRPPRPLTGVRAAPPLATGRLPL